jgi:polysaccharide biosynthesis transport protein
MAPPTDFQTVGPVDAFWRFRRRVVPLCVLIGLLGAVDAGRSADVAEASTSVYLTDPRGVPVFRDGATSTTDLLTYANQRADFAKSDATLEVAVSALGGELDLEHLRDSVTTSVNDSSSFIVVCRDETGERASDICEAVTDAYVNLTRDDTQRRATLAIDALKAARQPLLDGVAFGSDSGSSGAIEQIDLQIAQTSTKAALFDSGVEFVDTPEVTVKSRLLSVAQYGTAAFAFSLFVLGALSWIAAIRRPIVTDPESAAVQLGAPMVGHIDDRRPEIGYEAVATNLASVAAGGVVVVTSSNDSGAQSALVAGVAEAWAREGHNVLIIDGNPARPTLSKKFKQEKSHTGLTDLISDYGKLAAALRSVQISDGPALGFISAGQPVSHLSSRLRSATSRSVFASLKERFDIVLIDAPPMMSKTEGSALVSIADGVVVSVAHGTPLKNLAAVRRRLDVLHALLLGVIWDTEPAG